MEGFLPLSEHTPDKDKVIIVKNRVSDWMCDASTVRKDTPCPNSNKPRWKAFAHSGYPITNITHFKYA